MYLTFATISQNFPKHKPTATHRMCIKAEHIQKGESLHLGNINASLSKRDKKNLRCPYLQMAVSGLTIVNVFENKSSDIEKTHVTAVKISASHYSKEYAMQEYKMGNI